MGWLAQEAVHGGSGDLKNVIFVGVFAVVVIVAAIWWLRR